MKTSSRWLSSLALLMALSWGSGCGGSAPDPDPAAAEKEEDKHTILKCGLLGIEPLVILPFLARRKRRRQRRR